MYCKKILPVVNREYFESDQYLINKEYRKSIELLKNAYNETCELKETSCANCAKFIRSAITQSIINIQKEENRSSKRLFGLNRNPCESLSAKLVFKEIL